MSNAIALTGDDGVDVRLEQRGNGNEVEGVEYLAMKQASLRDMTVNASPDAFCQFVFHQSAEQTRGAPAFFISLFSKARPEGRDCGIAFLISPGAETMTGAIIDLDQLVASTGDTIQALNPARSAPYFRDGRMKRYDFPFRCPRALPKLNRTT